MLDTLLELFERDSKTSTSQRSSGGLRGRLTSALDGERDDDRRYDTRRSDDREHQRNDDDGRDDDNRSSTRKKQREFDFLDLGG